MKNTILWDVTPSNPVKTRRFDGAYWFHHQGRRISQVLVTLPLDPIGSVWAPLQACIRTRFSKHGLPFFLLAGCFSLLSDPEDGSGEFPQDISDLVSDYIGIKSHKIVLFIYFVVKYMLRRGHMGKRQIQHCQLPVHSPSSKSLTVHTSTLKMEAPTNNTDNKTNTHQYIGINRDRIK
jgi:hypothetical protein